MGSKYVFVAVLASAITIFALQNSAPASIRFLFWSLQDVPLATVILVSVAAGIVLAGVPLWFERWRLRARVGSLETRLAAAEALRGEQDRGPASPPSRA
jgi:uncharacterized integral membrane protein